MSLKISAEQIKELRGLTQAGMAACREALLEANGDMNKAVDLVKAKGLQNVSARSNRVASEGMVVAGVADDKITLVEINCQTDFVANSDQFHSFAEKVVSVLGNTNLFSFDGDLNKVNFESKSIEDLRKEVSASTGENVVVRRWMVEQINSDSARLTCYVHSNNKLATAVSFQSTNPELLDLPLAQELMDNVAMQVAAMNPVSVSRDRVPQEEKDRQQAIFETQLKEAGKPEAAWAKIVEGKFNKWFTEVCLLDQEAVYSAKKSVGTTIKELGDSLGCELKVLNFIRCQVGEGLEKKEENLAAAVAAAIGG